MFHGLPKGLKVLTLEAFEKCVGEDFEADAKPAPVKIRLEKLTKLNHGPGFMTREPFMLVWSTPAEVSMVLGAYRLRNGAWGPHEVYLEPMLSLSARRTYQSVFF